MSGVVVTGAGVVSPFGTGTKQFLTGLMSNTVTVAPAPWATEDGELFGWYCVVPDFEPRDWMDDRVVAGTDLFAQFALAAAQQSVTDARLEALDPRRTAVVHGTSMGGMRALMQAQHESDIRGAGSVDRKTLIKIWPNMAASQIAMRWQLHGPSLTICTACASSVDAIGTATRLIESGRADVAIAGGTEGGMPLASGRADGDFVPATFQGQAAYGMTTQQRDPLRASLPFDRDRSGIVTGEGSAMLVLEREEHARARGATVLGRIGGYGSLSDSYHPSSPDPSGQWEAEVMREALDDAGMPAAQVDALIAHATATPKGDTAEIRAINEVHSRRPSPLPVTSLKGHIGHTGAASGTMGAIVALNAMREGMLPNIAGTWDVDPEAEFRVVIAEPARIEAAAIQINAFGFGGQDASLVLNSSP